jgi:hypothetical protein
MCHARYTVDSSLGHQRGWHIPQMDYLWYELKGPSLYSYKHQRRHYMWGRCS